MSDLRSKWKIIRTLKTKIPTNATATNALNLSIQSLGKRKKIWMIEIQGRWKSVINKITKFDFVIQALVECVMSLICASAASRIRCEHSSQSCYFYTFVRKQFIDSNAIFSVKSIGEICGILRQRLDKIVWEIDGPRF